MALIPFKISRLKVRHTPVKYIILHHTVCQYPAPDSKIDNPKYQIPGIINGVLENKSADINFHYIVDKIKDDYQIITCRPFVTLCDYPDIDPDMNKKSIHIGLMGSYSFKIPAKRCYEVLSYRLLSPLLKMYGLAPDKILYHNEISKNKDNECPGDFVDKSVVISMVRKFLLK